MISESISKMILTLLAADSSVTSTDLSAMGKFLADGCVLHEGLRIVVDGDLMMSLSAAADFIGVSRDKFREVADEIVDGAPRFARMTLFGERHPRYYRIQLLQYGVPKSSPTKAGELGFKIAC